MADYTDTDAGGGYYRSWDTSGDGDGKIEFYKNLVGTTHTVCILAATNGALIVTLTLNDVLFKGVLLDASSSSRPSFMKVPKELGVETAFENETVYLEANDDDIGSAHCDRSVYDTGGLQRNKFTEAHRKHDYRRLRPHRTYPQLYVCSECKSRSYDSSESDCNRKNLTRQEYPALKISYKTPDGKNVMDIVQRKKRRLKSKHDKNKKLKIGSDDMTIDGLKSGKEICYLDAPDMETPANANSLKDEKMSEGKPCVKTKHTNKAKKDDSKSLELTTNSSSENGSPTEIKTKHVTTFNCVTGKQISVSDVIWGKIPGFPWWPGRVCAITATETTDGIFIEHIADIEWYNSPTKSHLPCSQLYPFLQDFEKRFDKKKKNSNYKKAISEAKYDAVLHAQYLESLQEDDCETGLPGYNSLPDSAVPFTQDATESTSAHTEEASNVIDRMTCIQPTSVLTDAFLRTSDSDVVADAVLDIKKDLLVTKDKSNPEREDDFNDYLTISLPSPESILKSL